MTTAEGVLTGAYLYSVVVMAVVTILAWRRDMEFRSQPLIDRIGASAFMIIAAPLSLLFLVVLLAWDGDLS